MNRKYIKATENDNKKTTTQNSCTSEGEANGGTHGIHTPASEQHSPTHAHHTPARGWRIDDQLVETKSCGATEEGGGERVVARSTGDNRSGFEKTRSKSQDGTVDL